MNRKLPNLFTRGWLVIACLLLTDIAAFAQASIKGGSNIEIKVAPTPNYDCSREGTKGRDGRWSEIILEFEIDGKKEDWADRMEIKFQVVVFRQKGKPIYMERTIAYRDVQFGVKNHAAVYIRSSFFPRYFKSKTVDKYRFVVRADIITIDGVQPKGHETTYKNKTYMVEWEKADSADFKVINDGLLKRSETPFGPLDYNYFLEEEITGK